MVFFFIRIYFIFGTCRERSTETTMGTHCTRLREYYYILCEYLVNRYRIYFFIQYNRYVYRYNSGCTPNKNDEKKPTTNLHNNTGNRPWKQTHRYYIHCSRVVYYTTLSFFISRHYICVYIYIYRYLYKYNVQFNRRIYILRCGGEEAVLLIVSISFFSYFPKDITLWETWWR